MPSMSFRKKTIILLLEVSIIKERHFFFSFEGIKEALLLLVVK